LDWPESEDPAVMPIDRTKEREIVKEAADRCDYRRTEEAKRAVEILERIKTLGRENLGKSGGKSGDTGNL
jgi:hypothetical protein